MGAAVYLVNHNRTVRKINGRSVNALDTYQILPMKIKRNRRQMLYRMCMRITLPNEV